jgi:hydroxycarboxylate dehydrogenase B
VRASAIARRLVSANLVGHDSHGVVRVTDYVQRLKAGKIRANGHVTVITDTEVFAILDGASAFGQVIGAEAMAIGMSKARNAGVALIALRRTHHLGRIGDWAEECANQGFASIHFVNAVDFGAVVAPFNGRDRRVSTNPFCCGMPGQHGRHLILDFATSLIAEGKVIVARNKGMEVPEGASSTPRADRRAIPMRFIRMAPCCPSVSTRVAACRSSARSSRVL